MEISLTSPLDSRIMISTSVFDSLKMLSSYHIMRNDNENGLLNSINFEHSTYSNSHINFNIVKVVSY